MAASSQLGDINEALHHRTDSAVMRARVPAISR